MIAAGTVFFVSENKGDERIVRAGEERQSGEGRESLAGNGGIKSVIPAEK